MRADARRYRHHVEVGSHKSIAILGAGITGLTAAHRLVAVGHRVRIFEKADHAGGVIRTEQTDGWLSESGPNSLLSGDANLTALLRELNLQDEVVEANPAAAKRYIVRDGKPVVAPLTPPQLFRSPLFSFGGKCRIFAELFKRPRRRNLDLSLANFTRDHFGQELVDYGLNPFVSGVYAGDPAKLSARYAFPSLWEAEQSHGSILRAQLAKAKLRRQSGSAAPKIISFRSGLATLTQALTRQLPADCLATNARVESLLPGQRWSVIWHREGETHTEEFDRVICTLPPAAAAHLRFGILGERPLAVLANLPMASVSSLYLGYKRSQVTHPLDGFGMLVPATERRAVLGVLFSSTLFSDRAPDGHVALTVMAGGTGRPELAALDTDALLKRVQPDLSSLLGVSGEPVMVRHSTWSRAIPQYNLGHERYLEVMSACEQAHPGLLIGGSARDGIALPACISAGEKLARRVIGQ
uniref:protoporphyrinogen oxidase n=1 Tax=Cephaloticoccus sp. TaxID=1985742 RepID=UPI0040495676